MCAVAVLAAACATRAVETARTPVTSGAAGLTQHGIVDGELVVRFTPEGERAVAAAVGQAPARLRFGVPSLDRLNAKYLARQLVPLDGERGAYRLILAPDANVVRAAEEYRRDALIRAAEPRYSFNIPRPAEAPNAVRMGVGEPPERRR